jgi:prephenate dehydrogenase
MKEYSRSGAAVQRSFFRCATASLREKLFLDHEGVHNMDVLIVGSGGEFGQFLQRDILPHTSARNVAGVERDTPSEEQQSLIKQARHIVLATPLAGYAELACELVYRCRDVSEAKTLWLIPSVQAGVWRAVTATLEMVDNPKLSALFVHPMYGPNGFRETELEARTFQNVLTATHEAPGNPLQEEVEKFSGTFKTTFNIGTTREFSPEQHDQITAYSQGLSYCVGRLMFQRPELAAVVQEQMPDLHRSFRANHDLIIDFLRINSYMPQVIAAFNHSWEQTRKAGFADILTAFRQADDALNRGADSPISTKWYERLRTASLE